MLIDIGKFLLIFFLVLISFACGLNQLYYYYTGPETTTPAGGVVETVTWTSGALPTTARPITTTPYSKVTVTGGQAGTGSPLIADEVEDHYTNPFDP
jgi:hypothetical protein